MNIFSPSSHIFRTVLVVALLLLGVSTVRATDYYVSPTGNDSNAGTVTSPYRSIQGNMWRLQPGDSMILRGGNYEGQTLSVNTSGTLGKPITFKAYPGEKPVLANIPGPAQAIDVTNKNYIVFDGINVNGVNGGHFIWMTGSSYITVKNCEFLNSLPLYVNGKWNVYQGLIVQYSNHIVFQNCYMDKDNRTGPSLVQDVQLTQSEDLIHVEYSKNLLFEGLTLKHGPHALIGTQDATNMIIRNNILQNDWQKVLGIASPHQTTPGRNVIENNQINGSRPAILAGFTGKGAMGIYISQDSDIIRRNRVYDNSNFGIILNGDNALGNSTVRYNKLYNNVVYKNGYLPNGSVSTAFDSVGGITNTDFYNGHDQSYNSFKNNIISSNAMYAWYVNTLGWQLDNNSFQGNCLYNPYNSLRSIDVTDLGSTGANSLSYYQYNFGTLVNNNAEGDPRFVYPSTTNPDFRLQAGSPCIDQGVSLTSVRAGGSGTAVPVYDAGYFTDGNDIRDAYGTKIMSGDRVVIGRNAPVTINSIDYTNNVLNISDPLSWSTGDTVNFEYLGGAPDAGVYEYVPTSVATPAPTSVPTAAPTSAPTVAPVPDASGASKTTITAVTASTNDGNVPTNTVDGDLNTRWSACGDGQWIKYDLGSNKQVGYLKLAVLTPATQIAKFDIEVSTDNTTWTKVFSGQSVTAAGLQPYDFADRSARYVRVLGHGNLTTTDSCWNSYTEAEVYTLASAATPTPTPTIAPTTPSVTPVPSAVALSTPCEADINKDGVVNQLDTSVLITNFYPSTVKEARADINKDSIVDLLDYASLVGNFSKTCSTSSITKVSLVQTKNGKELLVLDPTKVTVINPRSYPAYTIRVYTSPDTVGSVKFETKPDYRTYSITYIDDVSPYSIVGDVRNNYNVWDVGTGSYEITVTPYQGAQASGQAGTPLKFTVQVQ